MKQLKISELIEQLEAVKEEHGDELVYFMMPPDVDANRDSPLEVEGVDARIVSWGELKVVIV